MSENIDIPKRTIQMREPRVREKNWTQKTGCLTMTIAFWTFVLMSGVAIAGILLK